MAERSIANDTNCFLCFTTVQVLELVLLKACDYAASNLGAIDGFH